MMAQNLELQFNPVVDHIRTDHALPRRRQGTNGGAGNEWRGSGTKFPRAEEGTARSILCLSYELSELGEVE